MASKADMRYWARGASAADRNRRFHAITGKTRGGLWLWEDWELDIVRRLYPDYAAIHKLLKSRRTLKAIRLKAWFLGITKHHYHFRGERVGILRRLYRSASWEQLEAAFPGLSRQRIREAASRRHIYRIRPPLKPSKFPVVNEILKRCRELRLTLADLDEMTRANGYFRNGKFRRYLKVKSIRSAVALLSD